MAPCKTLDWTAGQTALIGPFTIRGLAVKEMKYGPLLDLLLMTLSPSLARTSNVKPKPEETRSL
ncbi:hypothetical protein NC651_024605 [Populus alba x Populus x berolinensis]|nr:hypothetical protein NC651_024605 [Populus alba x Populus x berolinensis]